MSKKQKTIDAIETLALRQIKDSGLSLNDKSDFLKGALSASRDMISPNGKVSDFDSYINGIKFARDRLKGG